MSKSDLAANVSTVIACVVLSSLAIWQYQSRPIAASRTAIYEQGDQLPALPTLSYSTHKRTLVLFVRSTCPFCTESMPLYKSILTEREAAKALLQVLAACSEDVDVCRNYLATHGVIPDAVVAVSLSSFKVRGTPTLVLVDERGKVLEAIAGKIPLGEEAAVTRRLIDTGY